MSDPRDTESNSHKPDQAERMREGYERQQDAERHGATTSAGGAGSTGTPGNSDDLDKTAEESGDTANNTANTARDSGE